LLKSKSDKRTQLQDYYQDADHNHQGFSWDFPGDTRTQGSSDNAPNQEGHNVTPVFYK